jgi:predicted O-methyltransferase YrrM
MRIETSWINRVVPAPLRRALRTAHRQRVFRRAVGDLRGLSAEEDPSEELLSALVYGWGNSAWSALGPYLTVLRRHALETDEEIVECGAGLSTIVLAVACEARPSAIVSLEHDPNWHHVVCDALARFRLNASVVHAPLRELGDYAWYNTSGIDLPERIGLVACDGPPGDGETKGGRIGMLPQLQHRLNPGCVILLDDVHREEERAILAEWASALRTDYRVIGETVGVLAVPRS